MERGNMPGQTPPASLNTPVEGQIVSQKTWTIQEVRAMTASQYAEACKDPAFTNAVDALATPVPRQTTTFTNGVQNDQ